MSQAAARADATTIAAITATSPQSQLAGLSGTPATINPQGDTARFVLADIKGKDAASAYRLSVIRTAVLELLKGNPRNLKEAIDMAAQLGKGKKARAYAAGFAPLMDVQAIERTGKWMDSANAAIRTTADTLADAYTAQFNSAHAAVMAEKAAPKAKKAAAPAPAPAASAPATDDSADATDATPAALELDVGELVDGVVSAMQQGLLSGEELVMLRAALAAMDSTTEGADAGLHHLLTRTPALLQQQAH